MSLAVTIANVTSNVVVLDELYASLGPVGSSNASLTITRSQAQLDNLIALKGLLHAGTVTVDIVPSADNEQIMSIPTTQFGAVGALSVASIAVVTSAVSFPKAYDVGVTPNISLSIVQGASTGFKAQVYARSVTNTGFTIALDVTSGGSMGNVTSVHWTSKG